MCGERGGGGEGGGGTDGGGGLGAVAPGGNKGGGGEGGVEGGVEGGGEGGVEGGAGGAEGGGGMQSRGNDTVPEEPVNSSYGPYSSGRPHCPVHAPPFQPSPYESNASSVQSARAYTSSSVPESGAPPDTGDLPSHVSVHEISLGQDPAETL